MATSCEVVDVNTIASTIPRAPDNEVIRENVCYTVADMLKTDTEVLILDGPDGIGKTTLLSQFVRANNNKSFCLFVRSSSRYAYDSTMLAKDLCEQIGWVLFKENYRVKQDSDPRELLRNRIFELQKKASYDGDIYYFVIDGLSDIPKEDESERNLILDLLPFGLPPFRFVLADCDLGARRTRMGHVKSLRLTTLTYDETRSFCCAEGLTPEQLGQIYKATKGTPGKLASLRRLLATGVSAEQLLEDLPIHLPDFFDMEWRVVDASDNTLMIVLSILAYDHRYHSLENLAGLCKIDSGTLEAKLQTCNFIKIKADKSHVDFESELFKSFAAKKLSGSRKEALNRVISELLKAPESESSLVHLPTYLHDEGHDEELLRYLSPEHIGRLIECGDSWGPLRQQASLGAITALKLRNDGHLLKFGLQQAAIKSMEMAEPWRSEVNAYMALKDFPPAYALTAKLITKEDRLHLLAVIARAKKQKSLPIESALSDQIIQLCSEIDKRELGVKGVEIASDLVYFDPELAIEFTKESISNEDADDSIDWAVTKMSLETLNNDNSGPKLQSIRDDLGAGMKNPQIRKFASTMAIFVGGYSAEQVLDEIARWEKAEDQIYVLKIWTVVNSRAENAIKVTDYALDLFLKITAFGANAKDYREIATPLLHHDNNDELRVLIDRFDGLKGSIESTGPTEEYLRLQVTLAEAESKYDPSSARNRLLDMFFYAEDLTDLSTKVSSLSIIAGALRRTDPDKIIESDGLHDEVESCLEVSIRELLSKTAAQYECSKTAIKTLARSNPEIAKKLALSLNTKPRRDYALIDIVDAVTKEIPHSIDFAFVSDIYGAIKIFSNRSSAVAVIVNNLKVHKKDCEGSLPKIIKLGEWVNDIADADERCSVLCTLLGIIFEYRSDVDDPEVKKLCLMLKSAWEAIDQAWLKIDMGFRASALFADSCASLSREFLDRTLEIRTKIVLGCNDSIRTYTACLRLGVRCFGGLIKRGSYSEDDVADLKGLINRIPSVSTRVIALSDLALKFYLSGKNLEFEEIVKQDIRPAIDAINETDQGSYWFALVMVSPALYCVHDKSALQKIEKIPQPYRDRALRCICQFLTDRKLPLERYENNHEGRNVISYDDFLDIIQVAEMIEADDVAYYVFEDLVNRLEKKFKLSFNSSQRADICHKCKGFVDRKFPNPDYISHDGYKILAEAQMLRLVPVSSAWDALIARARLIGNVADRIFVFAGIAQSMPRKNSALSLKLFNEAKLLIADIPTFDDRCNRYEVLANYSAERDTTFSKEVLALAWQESFCSESTDMESARKRLIDFAYRLDHDFASGLASKTENDPARELARSRIKERLDTLNVRDEMLTGKEASICEKKSIEEQIRVARIMLPGLNSRRIAPIHIEQTRAIISLSGFMKVDEAADVLSWIIENAVQRYSETDQVKTFIRPMYEAVKLSAELVFSLSAKIRSTADVNLNTVQADAKLNDSVIRSGEREKALEMLRDWASKETREFIKITDPYFTKEDLDLIQMLRRGNAKDPIYVLTSKESQGKDSQGYESTLIEDYRKHWRLNISDNDPGDVTIVVVGKMPRGTHPIHDRWMLSKDSGLRIGTSANSLGFGRVSDISKINGDDLVSYHREVDKYLSQFARECGGERLKYLAFTL
jgi:hypothetical protein